MESFKVIIAGGRYFNDYELLKQKADFFLSNKILTHEVVIVSGHASGADSLGERYAAERGLKVELFPADWNAYGKGAGIRRNRQMAEVANALIAFWDGQSRGTYNMISEAKARQLPTKVVIYK